MVEEQGIAPHIPVFDRSQRSDGTFSREDLRFDEAGDLYICPAGKGLTTTGALVNDGATLLYRGSTFDCSPCEHKNRCCPNTPARKIPRSTYERARNVARALAGTPEFEQSRRERKRVEMLFAHLKRILRLGPLRLRGPSGARDEFLLAATAQNLRKLAKLVPTTSFDPTLA
jgi:Transposase DDE domain